MSRRQPFSRQGATEYGDQKGSFLEDLPPPAIRYQTAALADVAPTLDLALVLRPRGRCRAIVVGATPAPPILASTVKHLEG